VCSSDLLFSGQVSEVGSDGFEMELVSDGAVQEAGKASIGSGETKQKQFTIFESKLSGEHFAPHDGTEDGARAIQEMVSGGVSAPRTVTRWEFEGGWRWAVIYYDPQERVWAGTDPVGTQNKSNDAFNEFMISEPQKYLILKEGGGGAVVGTFFREIEGIEYEFTKWEFLTEAGKVVRYWEGVPTH